MLNDSDSHLDYRCEECGKLLFKKHDEDDLEIKCLRCGKVNTIFHGMKEQVVITDPQGRILFVNGEVERITGYHAHEIIGKTPKLWGNQMSKKFYEELWRIIFVEKKSLMAKIVNKHKSGKKYNALLRISPILNTDGSILFFIGIESKLDGTSVKEGENSILPQIV